MSTQPLLQFLKTQRVTSLAMLDEQKKPWIANFYNVVDDDFITYFVSGMDTHHSKYIVQDGAVAFASTRYDPNDALNRKATQGTGECSVVTDRATIIKAIGMHNTIFPVFATRITSEFIIDQGNSSYLRQIKPKSIKFWSDEEYGLNGVELFEF